MKSILRTSSVSFAESLVIALEAEDIAAIVTNENSAGITPPAITVTITDDDDYERALAALRGVEVTGPATWFTNRRILRLTVAVIVALTTLICFNL
jgi:hypothetical protein